MNVLHKARAHLATLERFIDDFPNKRAATTLPLSCNQRTETINSLGRAPLTTVPSEVELVAASRHVDVSHESINPPRIVWPRPGRGLNVSRNPAFAVVASAWASITSSLESGMASMAQRNKANSTSSGTCPVQASKSDEHLNPVASGASAETIQDSDRGRTFVQVRESVNVLTNASRYSQTMRTPRHRIEWVRMIFGAWCFRCFRPSSSQTRQACSACFRTLGFPSFNIPCVCPVCFELFCPQCYGGSTLSRLFGDRGCRRCAIVVQRYEHFHGCTARILEAGIYCVVSAFAPNTVTAPVDPKAYSIYSSQVYKRPSTEPLVIGVRDTTMFDTQINDLDPASSQHTTNSDELVTVASTGYTGTFSDNGYTIRGLEVFPESDDAAVGRTVTCFTFQPRPLNPLGELDKNRALMLDRLTQQPLEDSRLLAIPGIGRLTSRCAAWFFLNVDTAEFEFRSIGRQNNKPLMQGSLRIELIHAIEAMEETRTVILYKLAPRRKTQFIHEDAMKIPWWSIQFLDFESWTQWTQNIKLAWELLAPERVEQRARTAMRMVT